MVIWNDADTICAVATPPGRGGIAVIRVSGADAVQIAKSTCPFLPDTPESHRVYYGYLQSKEETIDEVLVSYFAHGRSFTTQPTIEISCHGNPLITDRIVSELIKNGARAARAGEFTLRAFLNGRIDLIQSESVLNLIESSNVAIQRVATRQLQGELSTELQDIQRRIVHILAHIEASIDFSTENLEVISPTEIITQISGCYLRMQVLTASYSFGQIARQGLRVVLVGAPNAGKSSLLNYLVNSERSIVSEAPGTTRDYIEARLLLQGIPVTVVDTAGLRESGDDIERQGVLRSQQQGYEADIALYVVDQSTLTHKDVENCVMFGEARSRQHVLARETPASADTASVAVILAKSDLVPTSEVAAAVAAFAEKGFTVLSMSSHAQRGKANLLQYLEEFLQKRSPERDESFLVNARHYEGLQRAQQCLSKALRRAQGEAPIASGFEFLSLDLQEAVTHIKDVLGESTDEAIIDRIFKEFCLGK